MHGDVINERIRWDSSRTGIISKSLNIRKRVRSGQDRQHCKNERRDCEEFDFSHCEKAKVKMGSYKWLESYEASITMDEAWIDHETAQPHLT